MKVLENAIKEIKTLKPDELMRVYDMIIRLKTRRIKIDRGSKQGISARSRVLEALKNCNTDFSTDIINSREDRF